MKHSSGLFYVIAFFLFDLIFLLSKSSAADGKFGYRVTEPNKTVIQIARDLYNDERQWKGIAYRNGLKKPYKLNVGQILILPMAPTRSMDVKNQVSTSEIPDLKITPQLPQVSRVLKSRVGYDVYEVNERAHSLSMVAVDLYGDKSMFKVIARWNGLNPNDHISLSQKLVLHLKPTLDEKKANELLIQEWQRLGNTLMVQRLRGQPIPTQQEEQTVLPVAAKPEPQVTDRSLPEKVVASTIRQPAAVPPTRSDDTNPTQAATVPASDKQVSSSQAITSSAGTDQPSQSAATPDHAVSLPTVPDPTATLQATPDHEDPELKTSTEISKAETILEPEPTTESYWLGSDTYRIIKKLSGMSPAKK